MSPISARSRRPTTVDVSMLPSSARASVGSSIGVCPDVTTCRGPRTDAAGLTGTTWPVTSQFIHGDAHWWNCFVPRNSQHEQVRLLDREDWTTGTGTTDLAYMIAMLWFPDRRRNTEQHLLNCYHDTLLVCGVTGYS